MELVKYNNNSISSVTALGSLSAGGLNLLATNNITSGVSSSSFTSNIDSTYDTYMFKFISIHPATDADLLLFNFSTDGGSNYNVTKTTTAFGAQHKTDGTGGNLSYFTSLDLAQSTGYAYISDNVSSDASHSYSGEMFLFNPSSTTFVKHFLFKNNYVRNDNRTENYFFAGYGNTTSAVDAIDFKFASGNIDSGVIKMYGLSKS